MELEAISQQISNYGFPIMCCYFMWRYINTTMKEFQKTMSENTNLLSRICERLDLWAEKDKKEGS